MSGESGPGQNIVTSTSWLPGWLTLWPPHRAVESLRRHRLVRDVAWLQASNAVIKGYGFLFSVLTVRLLGAAGYGDFLQVLVLYQTINLLGNLGLGQFLVVPTAQAAAARDRQALAAAIGYQLKLSITIAAGVTLVSLAVGPWLSASWYQREDLGAMMRIVALGGLPAAAYNLAVTALQSVRRMRELALVENVDAVAGRAAAVVAIVAGWGVTGMLAGLTLGGLISAVHALYQYRRVAVGRHDFPDFPALVASAWRVPLKRYFRFSALAVLDKNVGQFFGQTPLLFLGRWGGSEEVAYFNIATKVFTLLAAFHGAASRAFSVRLSQELAQHGAPATRRLFWRTSLVWGALSCAMALGLGLCLPIFRWVYEPQNLQSIPLVVILGLLAAKQGFTVSLGAIYLIMNRVATNALVKIPLMLVWMPIGAWMVQHAGAPGAAAYQLGAYLTGDLIYFSILAGSWFWRPPPPRETAK
ncbi:MAG TPA: oligosaccharide flippase family protein [Chloroflexota bacterium]|nr:oligosaccharide flippase family protein [Chloroflexota bacterium]